MVRSLLAVGLLQYQAIAAPVSVPTPPAETPEMGDRVKAVYVHKVYPRPRTVDYRSGPTVPVFVPNVTIDPLTWKPTYPDRLTRRRIPVSSVQASSHPPFQPPTSFASGGQFIATGSIRNLLQYQAVTGPFHEQAVETPTDVALIARQAERTWRARAIATAHHQYWVSDKFTAPTPATVPEVPWLQPSLPVRRVPRLAIYERVEPIFGYMVPVPVMSWTGVYLDPPVRRRVRYQPEPKPFPLDYDTTINAPAPAHAWDAYYPDRLHARARRAAAYQAPSAHPLYVPEVTTGAVVALSWQGRYADRVPAKRALHAGQHPAFFFDRFAAPDEVIAPDLAAPVYVDRVYGRQPITHHHSYLAPDFVPDVTNPVGGIEWLALYPDRIDRETLPVTCKLSWTGLIWSTELVPAAVIHEIDGRGSYMRKIYGRGSYDPSKSGRGSL